MMRLNRLTRRDFLKLGALAMSASPALLRGAAIPTLQSQITIPFPPTEGEGDYGKLMRVAIREVDLRARPNDSAEIVGKRYRDQVVHVYYELEPSDAPKYYNKLWYRVWGGYLHSATLQPVEIHFNPPLRTIREGGQLAEVTVPYTQSYRYDRYAGWQVEYRLYYQTTHWITGIAEGPDGEAWYQLTDELQPWDYLVPTAHLRPIPDSELAPLSADLPPEDKRIEVNLASQTLTAFEKDQEVFTARISSGIPRSTTTNNIPTATPKGNFRIYSKMPSKHMGDGRLMRGDLDLEAYELVGVPWTMFFHKLETGYALHGTYWHNNFGWQMSHGCVNMRNAEAKWLFRWTTPVSEPTAVETTGYGTAVHID